MHPVIAVFQLPILGWVVQFDSYPFMHLVAFVVLVGLTLRLYRRDVGPPLPALDPLLVGIGAGIVGARLVGAWTSGKPLTNFLDSPQLWWLGNKSAYGGLMFGILAGMLTARLRGLPVVRYLDAGVPALALATVCARIGCFLGGCCWGLPTDSFLAVHFPEGHPGMEPLAVAHDPRGLHPTQLYLAASALAIAGIALLMRRHRVGRPGDRFLVSVTLYSVSVFGIEYLRGDTQRWVAAGLSHSQWISAAALALVGVSLLLRAARLPLRAAMATGTVALILGGGAPAARADDGGAGDGMLETADVLVQALASGHPGAADTFAWLLELGDARLATWSRLGLGADAVLRGDLERAVDQWGIAAAVSPGTTWAAQGELALGLGRLMQGRRDQAVVALRRAAAYGEGDTVAVAEVSLGRLLAAEGDRVGAEQSFRRVFEEYPASGVADDAAHGLAKSLVGQGRVADARDVLGIAEQRYERRGRYMSADRDTALRWDRLARFGPERLGRLLRERIARAAAAGRPPLDAVLGALTDRYAGHELRRMRVRLARSAPTSGEKPPVEPAIAAAPAEAPLEATRARQTLSPNAVPPARPSRRTLTAALTVLTLLGLGAALRRRMARLVSPGDDAP